MHLYAIHLLLFRLGRKNEFMHSFIHFALLVGCVIEAPVIRQYPMELAARVDD